ncbi:MAG TPA: ribonuclease H-like domain-containing protein [Kiritimatiellia bacterium]|nr:ribonuclease H-like domain-containing protein [Kiritimatiellia bacterium]
MITGAAHALAAAGPRRHLEGALRHLPGFGPKKIAALQEQGAGDWSQLLEMHQQLPGLACDKPAWVTAIQRDRDAAARGDLRALVASLHRADHWRILADFPDQAAYVDIETSGDQAHPEITVVAVNYRGRVFTFTAERDLHRFLDLLDTLSLLVTFNGASFDIPQLEAHFHIPMNDIAHIDLRWSCYHAGLKGGLKEIERQFGLIRPPDLLGVDGAEADWLWRRWKMTGQPHLVAKLIRYCAADVVGLEHLAHRLIAQCTGRPPPDYSWDTLPPPDETVTPHAAAMPPERDASSHADHLRERLRASLRLARSR